MIDTESPIPAGRNALEKAPDTRGLRSLVDRARLGSTDAFADAVTILHPLVYRWALTYARDIDEAEEITQETFVLIYRKLDQYRGESAVEGWVYLITRRVALARTRKNTRRQMLRESGFEMETVYNTDPESRVDRQRIAEYIRTFFTKLPARQREVFDLVDLQGHDPAEVAGLLGMKAATVRANLFKARQSIRAHLMQNHPAWEEVSK